MMPIAIAIAAQRTRIDASSLLNQLWSRRQEVSNAIQRFGENSPVLANNDTDLSYAGQEKKIKNLYNRKMCTIFRIDEKAELLQSTILKQNITRKSIYFYFIRGYFLLTALMQ